MDNSRYKFRAWQDGKIITQPITGNYGLAAFIKYLYEDAPLMQYTGLKDKNGKEIYCGDLLNVVFTSNGKKHTHDCVYRVGINDLYGITLSFEKLLWVSHGYNQYPSAQTLTSRHSNLREDYVNQNYDQLAVMDTHGENHIFKNRWKETDYSNYIEVIGNIFELPELLGE